jgi:hypothetical protein
MCLVGMELKGAMFVVLVFGPFGEGGWTGVATGEYQAEKVTKSEEGDLIMCG